MPYVKCKVCEKSFYLKPSHQKKGYGKYCSKSCNNIGQRTGKWVNCAECGKAIWRTPKQLRHSISRNFFCTKSCQTHWRNRYFSGSKSLKWKNGIHAYRDIMLRGSALKKCRMCGQTDLRVLIVHHVDQNRTNNSKNNLEWLCYNCHALVHHYPEEADRLSVIKLNKFKLVKII